MKETEKCRQGKLCNDLVNLTHPYETGMCGFVVVRHIKISQLEKSQIGLEELDMSGVGYKSSAKHKGVMLNYCPFCGARIDWFRKKEGKKK
jgi:hypothetical protein